MLAIRMQRTGRKGYASFRVVVQDSRFTPTSGRVVAKLGHYNPHTKETVIDTVLAEQYLSNGAQPTPRVVKLFKSNKVSLPSWVSDLDTSRKKTTKNPEKLRKNQPAEPEAAESDVAAKEEPVVDETPKSADDATPKAADAGDNAQEKESEAPAKPVAEEKTEEPAEEPAAEEKSQDEPEEKA